MSIRVTGQFLLALFLLSPMFLACDEDDAETTVDEIGAVSDDGAESADPFTSADGRFTVTFPNGETDPSEQVVPVPTEIGQIDMHMFLVDADTEAYMAAWADYPSEIVAAGDPQTMLDMGRDGAIANVNGELLRENDYKLQGFPAKEFYAKGVQGGQDVFMRANIIMANDRLYQVLYLSFEEDDLDSKTADNYVASFRIDEAAADQGDEDLTEEEVVEDEG